MLTHLAIRNFKRFGSVEIELGSPVVFIGPNNSGKTSAMQALALWDIGLRRWTFYCRPLRLSEDRDPERMPVPEAAGQVQIAFLPPMSGLAATESRLDQGAVNVRVGEGRTAEVLRNLCHRVHGEATRWSDLVKRIRDLFGAELRPPRYIAERGEIAMSYREHGIELDLSSAGRGLQQTLLLLAYMYANHGAVLLLDVPDAHLEILRQRQIYQLLSDTAEETGSQIVAASHSEVLLNEAVGRAMRRSIESIEAAMKKLGKGSPWDPLVKASDDFLNPLFADYFERLGLPNVMLKKSFHVLARHVPKDEIDAEIMGQLDAIAAVADGAEG